MSFTTKATIASFGGTLLKLSHDAASTGTPMALNLYLPPQASTTHKVPILFYLAGLTCTGDNGSEKGFFQHAASRKGIAIVYPDTSPRGLQHPEEDASWDFGTGAGFYVDATKAPWSTGYKMYSYITAELPRLLPSAFPQLDSTRYLKNPQHYKSVSAFAPIANPSKCPWGQKAFGGYFGEDQAAHAKWAEHDATELVRSWDLKTDGPLKILIDVGYDHSYYFMSSFADQHVEHAAKYLLA
ncbi:MAG: hypothetical protein M1838_000712 [Thelocarpon superellum]|nr:MAG: hypothetical protein M1838_000712 [Thelocarpon superellum]